MKIAYVFLLTSIFLFSCSNKVHFKLVGKFEFKGKFTSTIQGKPTSGAPYTLRETYAQFLNICSDQQMEENFFREECIVMSKLELAEVKKVLEDHDVILTIQPIKKILKRTPYTKQDACEYRAQKIVELVFDERNNERSKIYIYKVAPKNRYRLHLCP